MKTQTTSEAAVNDNGSTEQNNRNTFLIPARGDKINGYGQLSQPQQAEFDIILDKFLASYGVDARENIKIDSVEPQRKNYRINITRYGVCGYQILNPRTGEWW